MGGWVPNTRTRRSRRTRSSISSTKTRVSDKFGDLTTADAFKATLELPYFTNGNKKNMTPGEQSVRNYAIGDNDKIITLMSSHHRPFNFYHVKEDEVINLTNYNKDILKNTKLANVKRLIVPGWKKEPVESFIYYPPDYDSQNVYPTIFVLHGGPVSQHDTSFDEFAQIYAAKGYTAQIVPT